MAATLTQNKKKKKGAFFQKAPFYLNTLAGRN
jgi:hypothetical protein